MMTIEQLKRIIRIQDHDLSEALTSLRRDPQRRVTVESADLERIAAAATAGPLRGRTAVRGV